jgi:flagellar hook assembly protein FlgD
VTGRLVRTLRPGPEASGRGVFFWDGNDEQGRPVSPGIYFGRPVEGNGRTVRIVRIR